MTARTNIGSALLALRTSQNLSVAQISDLLNVSVSAYSAYEHGQRLPDIKILLQISIYYKINIEFLFFLLCIDAASMAQIENTDLFQSFTYGFLFPWKFFQTHDRFQKLPANYQTAVHTFVEAAEICHKHSIKEQ